VSAGGFRPSDTPVPARAGAGIPPSSARSTRLSFQALLCWWAVGTALLWTTSAPQATALHGAASGRATRYADGAPPGFSGGFTEQSCDACHFEAAVNTRPGDVTVTGVPERFVAGQQYPLVVTLTRPGMKLGGFQLAARFADGTQAGTFERGAGEDGRLAIETQSNVQYANQKRKGAEPTAPDTAKWTLVWTAPAGRMPVTFNVAANAADNDESARGDYVFTATASSRPE
jgi:hypothetical protein